MKSLVLITAGFKETGKEGEQKEIELVGRIRESGAHLVGPNCMGVINSFSTIRLNATFVAEHPKEAHSAFLSQSGALGAAVLNSLRISGVSFGHFVSVGNKADLNENDFLEFWLTDDNITSVAMYLESFVDGITLLRKYRSGMTTKPLVIVKGGRTSGGMRAASSHTGALGSSDRVVDSLLRQFGVIRAYDIDEMFNTLKGFEYFPLPAGNRIGVVTNAGGPAILCVDALEKAGLVITDPSTDTKSRLREFVHPEGSVNNPVDLLPGGTADQYKKSVELLIADENIDAVVSIFVEPVMVPALPVIEAVNSITSTKPVYQVALPLPEFWQNYETQSRFGIPIFRRVEDPARVIANLLAFRNRDKSEGLLPKDTIRTAVRNSFLDTNEIASIMNKYGLPLVESQVIPAAGTENYKEKLNYPVVVKGIANGITHKSDKNLVRLNIRNAHELLEVCTSMTTEAIEQGFTINSFLVQPFIQTRFELLLGGFRDPSFGPVLMFGSGGKYVEAINDTAMCSAFLTERDIYHLIDSVAIGRLLKGVRGETPADLVTLHSIIKSTAQMFLDFPALLEFDMNPLILTTGGEYVCVDVRMKVQ